MACVSKHPQSAQRDHSFHQYCHKFLAYNLTWGGGGERERLLLSILLLASISTAQCKLGVWGKGGGVMQSRYLGSLCYARIVIWVDTVLHNLVSCIVKHLLSTSK
jgi:hypothetical protein